MASWTSAIPAIGDGRVSVDCASFDGLLLGADGQSKFFGIKSISYGIEKSEWGVSKLTDAAFKALISKAKVQGRGPWRCTSPMGMGPFEGVFMNLIFFEPLPTRWLIPRKSLSHLDERGWFPGSLKIAPC